MTDRPLYYPYHDVYETNIVLPQDSLYIFSGYPAGLPVPSADHNGKFNSNYKWAAYLDQGTLRNTDWLSTSNAAISTTQLTYVNGDNVTTTGAQVKFYASYLLNGNRIEIDDAALNGVGAETQGSPLIMPGAILPGRIWVYSATSGVVRFEAVAAGTPDAPVGSEITLGGLDVDAAGVVTDGGVVPVTLPLPSKQLTIAVPVVITGSDTVLSIVGGGPGAPAVTIDGQADIGLSVQTNSANAAAAFKQNGAGTAITAQGNVSITANLAVDGDTTLGTGAGVTTTTIGLSSADALSVAAAATFTSLVRCHGDTLIGNADTDTLTVTATATFQNDVTIGSSNADALVVNSETTFAADIDFGANDITGTGGSLTTTTVTVTTAIVTNVNYNTGAGAAPTGNGETEYDGRSLTIGDGSAVRQFHTPIRNYTVSDTTTLAIEDITGASITMVIGNNEWVYFTLSAAHLLSAGDTFNVLLAATNGVDVVTVLNSGDDDAASYGFTFGAAQKITQTITVRWKPTNDIAVPDNTNWTIRVRHGVSGGNTLTTSNVELQGWYEPT